MLFALLTTLALAVDTGLAPPPMDTATSPPADTAAPPADTGTSPPADTAPADTQDTGMPTDTGMEEPDDTAVDEHKRCCVCEYDDSYACDAALTEDACWVAGFDWELGPGYCDWEAGFGCRSIFDQACDDWFAEPAQASCDETVSQPYDALGGDPTGGLEDCDQFSYSYEGHATPESCVDIVDTVRICVDTFPACNLFDVDWDGCSTFEDPDAAAAELDWIRCNLEPGQFVEITSNQCPSNDVCRSKLTYYVDLQGVSDELHPCHAAGEACFAGADGTSWTCLIDDPAAMCPFPPQVPAEQACCCDDFWTDDCLWLEPGDVCPVDALGWLDVLLDLQSVP